MDVKYSILFYIRYPNKQAYCSIKRDIPQAFKIDIPLASNKRFAVNKVHTVLVTFRPENSVRH